MTELFGPLRSRAFRWLEGTALFANAGVWMVTLVGGFIMERLTTSPVLVTLAAAIGPLAGMLAVVFSGAAADSQDRRAGAPRGEDPARKLGCLPGPDVVVAAAVSGDALDRSRRHGDRRRDLDAVMVDDDREPHAADLVPAAFSLDSFQWNIGQVVGPVLGGAVLRGAGTTVFFALCGAVMVPLVSFLLMWRGRDDLRLSTPGGSATESLLGSISSGWRYFANTPGLRAIGARTALYVTPAAALGALLPLFAAHYLHVSAFGYGLILAGGGVGAMFAALVLPRLQGRLNLDAVVAAATLTNSLALVALVLWPTRWAVVPALFVTGASWVWATVALIIAARQVTPDWVQSRSLSLYYIVLQGPFVLGGLGFGVIDSFLPLRETLLIAALALVPGILLIPRFRLPVVDRSSLQLVASPSLVIGEHVHPEDGPVMILIEYRVDGDDVDDFLCTMAELRIVRRRLGGTRWGVYQDVTAYGKFFETFLVPSWNGYILQRAPLHKGGPGGREPCLCVRPGLGRTEDNSPGSPRYRRGRPCPFCLAAGDASAPETAVGAGHLSPCAP